MIFLTRDEAIDVANNLKSEYGETPEYDRALVEFIWDAFGGSSREDIAKELGMDIRILYQEPKGGF